MNELEFKEQGTDLDNERGYMARPTLMAVTRKTSFDFAAEDVRNSSGDPTAGRSPEYVQSVYRMDTLLAKALGLPDPHPDGWGEPIGPMTMFDVKVYPILSRGASVLFSVWDRSVESHLEDEASFIRGAYL